MSCLLFFCPPYYYLQVSRLRAIISYSYDVGRCPTHASLFSLFFSPLSALHFFFFFSPLTCAQQEIFHQQLPKMPKEYIVRLVFDRKHRSIVLTKNGTPIGGITYRAFEEQKFGEIAFCAVASSSQVNAHVACDLRITHAKQ